MWKDIPRVKRPPANGEHATEAPESGYGALVVWCAGPDHAMRVRLRDLSAYRVVTETTDAAGRVTRTERPRTPSDQDETDAELNEYLTEAGIEPRPSGYRWFITVPPTLNPPARLWDELNTALTNLPPTATHPRDTRRAVQEALPALLRSDTTAD